MRWVVCALVRVLCAQCTLHGAVYGYCHALSSWHWFVVSLVAVSWRVFPILNYCFDIRFSFLFDFYFRCSNIRIFSPSKIRIGSVRMNSLTFTNWFQTHTRQFRKVFISIFTILIRLWCDHFFSPLEITKWKCINALNCINQLPNQPQLKIH